MFELSMMVKQHCEDCYYCKITSGEVIYCAWGEWSNRQLAQVKRLVRDCRKYEPAEYGDLDDRET